MLVLFLNELSVDDEGINPHSFLTSIGELFNRLVSFLIERKDVKLGISSAFLNGVVAGRPLISWLESAISKDKFVFIKGRIVLPRNLNHGDGLDLLLEVTYAGNSSLGMTLAHIRDSWVISLINEPNPWDQITIQAQKKEINENGEWGAVEPILIKNLSDTQHLEHWQQSIEEWGNVISGSSIISTVDGYHIVMYSCDHLPPHIHLIKASTTQQVGKYTIDTFDVLETKEPRMNNTLKEWINTNKASLLQSWERCQKGGRPYSIH